MRTSRGRGGSGDDETSGRGVLAVLGSSSSGGHHLIPVLLN